MADEATQTSANTPEQTLGKTPGRPIASPFESLPCEVYFSDEAKFTVPKSLLDQIPNLIVPESSQIQFDITSDVGHVVIYYLLSGTYQCLLRPDASERERLVFEFQTGVRVYIFSEEWRLATLRELAAGEMWRLAAELPLPLILNELQSVHLSPADEWISAYLEQELGKVLGDPTPFKAVVASEVAQPVSFSDVLLTALATLLAEKSKQAFEENKENPPPAVDTPEPEAVLTEELAAEPEPEPVEKAVHTEETPEPRPIKKTKKKKSRKLVPEAEPVEPAVYEEETPYPAREPTPEAAPEPIQETPEPIIEAEATEPEPIQEAEPEPKLKKNRKKKSRKSVPEAEPVEEAAVYEEAAPEPTQKTPELTAVSEPVPSEPEPEPVEEAVYEEVAPELIQKTPELEAVPEPAEPEPFEEPEPEPAQQTPGPTPEVLPVTERLESIPEVVPELPDADTAGEAVSPTKSASPSPVPNADEPVAESATVPAEKEYPAGESVDEPVKVVEELQAKPTDVPAKSDDLPTETAEPTPPPISEDSSDWLPKPKPKKSKKKAALKKLEAKRESAGAKVKQVEDEEDKDPWVFWGATNRASTSPTASKA